jgi:hypothetical protein
MACSFLSSFRSYWQPTPSGNRQFQHSPDRGNVLAIRSKHDASGDTHAVSAHVETIDSAHQLELDFRAPVLQMVLPNQETLKFWRATADYPQEVADRIAKVSRSMQQYASASTRVTNNKSKP